MGEDPSVAVDIEQVIREYLKILKGARTQAVLAKALGYKTPSSVSMILGDERSARMEHLQLIANAWQMKTSDILGDLAQIAINLELGKPPNHNIGGAITARAEAAISAAERAAAESGQQP